MRRHGHVKMQIDAHQRSVALSVRELASFRNRPASERIPTGQWRAAVGRDWHQSAAQQTRANHPDARFEIPVTADWRHADWRFKIRGRIDQLIPTEDGYLIREIKTVRHSLPASEEDLASAYPDYFAQVAIYLGLAGVLAEFAEQTLRAELVLIDIDTGTLQTIPLDAQQAARFEQQLQALLPFLQDRREARLTLENCQIKPAFQQLREGQAELQASLNGSALRAKTVLLEAPTGFGKTGIVLEHALQQLQAGVFQRCIYLSSKSTGQLQTIQQLRAMIGSGVRYLQMRNRTEHRIDTTKHSCSATTQCERDSAQLWYEANIHPPQLFMDGTLSLESAKSIGAETGICPYTLSKCCLPFAEVWIGDSNYIFSPQSQSVFNDAIGFDPAQTLLIVDEAHNLPQRAADALSVEVQAAELLFALEELRLAGAPRRLLNLGEELSRRIEALPSQQAIPANTQYTLLDLCEDFAQQLTQLHLDWAAVAPFALEKLWSIPQLAQCLANNRHQWLHWAPSAGSLRASCLDARQWISECLEPFGGSILMSATLTPSQRFREDCGLTTNNSMFTVGHAPWRAAAYEVAIDTRVDTRLKHREHSYTTTAHTVASMIHQSPGVPVAVFFPSYQYAQTIEAYLSAIHPELRIGVQPRGVDLAEQESFIEQGLVSADALFLILGSSYAEGVDQLGGQVASAIVVGPALPEVNCIQAARMESLAGLSREERFRQVYIEPAMRRIHQALGRLVRAPGQHARILLHGRRYAEPAYYEQLAPEYQTELKIDSDVELLNWLQGGA